MDKNNVDKKWIMQNFFDTLELLSNKTYQKNAWILGKGPFYCDFDESFLLFIECKKALLQHFLDFNFSELHIKLLENFTNELNKFAKTIGREHPPGDFIDSPEWTRITELAKEVLKAFHRKKS